MDFYHPVQAATPSDYQISSLKIEDDEFQLDYAHPDSHIPFFHVYDDDNDWQDHPLHLEEQPSPVNHYSSLNKVNDCETRLPSTECFAVSMQHTSQTFAISSSSSSMDGSEYADNFVNPDSRTNYSPSPPASDSEKFANSTQLLTTDRTRPPRLGKDISYAEAERRLRHVHNLPPTAPLSLKAIQDPPPPSVHYDTIVQLAIWASPQKRMVAAEIYDTLQQNFKSKFPEGFNMPWRRSIRHMLSFKRAFVKSEVKDHSGKHYWELDFDHLDWGYKRDRKRNRVVSNSTRHTQTRRRNCERSARGVWKRETTSALDEFYLKDGSFSPPQQVFEEFSRHPDDSIGLVPIYLHPVGYKHTPEDGTDNAGYAFQ